MLQLCSGLVFVSLYHLCVYQFKRPAIQGQIVIGPAVQPPQKGKMQVDS